MTNEEAWEAAKALRDWEIAKVMRKPGPSSTKSVAQIQRRFTIFRMYLASGKSLAQIGREAKITGERVRHIVRKIERRIGRQHGTP